jgi:WD40 repeat protein
MVVDGRIVVGGGSDGLRFAQWDLDSGAVRVFADHHDFDVDTVGTLELPGRSLFLVSPEAEAVALWDVVGNGTGERTGELNARCDRAAATGMLGQRPVLVTADEDGYGIQVWDLNDRARLVGFDEDLETEEGEENLLAVGLANVGGRPRVVAAGACGSVVLGDIDSGKWGEPFAGAARHDETDVLMDTGTVNGLPIAVTCTYDPYPAPDFTSVLRAWDLEGGHALGGPVAAHEGGALGIQLTELDGRTVAVTVGRSDASVRVWALDR